MADQNGPQTTIMDAGDQLPVGEGQNGTAPVPAPPQAPPQTVQAPPPQPPADPLADHPSVQQASVIRRVGETIAGGPRVTTKIDPNTGEITREKQPLQTKDILLGALANILGSVGQVSGNLSNRMQGRSPQPIQPLPSQQAQQQQAQQSEEDFNRVQNQKVRQAKVLNANLEAMRTAYALGKENDDAKDSAIANHKDDLENWSKAGAVEASNVPSNELMQKGFDKTKYVAIPDGRVPVFNPDGTRATDSNGVPLSQLTYSVVDGTTQAPLTQDKYNQLAKYGLMTAKEGFKLPEGASVSSAQLALMNHKLDLIQQTQRELDEVTGDNKVDLAAQIKKNPQILSAIEKFHNDGASTEPDNQINNLQAKNPAAAGLMRELFGNDNLEKYKENRNARAAAEKTKQETEARVNAEANTPAGKQKLTNATLEGEKLGLEVDKLKKDNAAADMPTGQVVNGVDQTALSALPVSEQRTAQMIMDGRMELSPQTLRTAFGAGWAQKLGTIFPGDSTHEGFDASKAKAYEKLRQDYTSGKSFQRIQASDNALGHLNQYLNASQSLKTTFPGVTKLTEYGAFGKQAQDLVKQRESAIEFISEETAKATKGGVPDKAEVERIRGILEGATPSNSASAAKSVAMILKTPIDELQSGWESGVPFGQVSPLTHLMSPEAQQSYQNLTGEKPKWAGRPHEPQQQTGGGNELIQNPKTGQPQQNKQQVLQSITLPGGGKPADVKFGPNGSMIVWSGKAGDPWINPATGQPVQ